MKLTNNTVLITGGSAGIGFEIAKLLIGHGNEVIIVGRDQKRLADAKAKLPLVNAIKADVTNAAEVADLVLLLQKNFPKLNMVVNNAGSATLHNLADENVNTVANAESEMITNYLAVIRLNQFLLPMLKQQIESAIVNVSSIVAYVPGITLPTYAASKAALHSYTTSLRLSLESTSVKVFELMPPLVDTQFSSAIGGHLGIHPSAVADALLVALQRDDFEIRVGDTAKMYELMLASPMAALNMMNGR